MTDNDRRITGAYFDAEGRFIHNCEICGAPAYQGRNVNLRQGRLGTWRDPIVNPG
jgi:hypothetical protein